VSRFQARLSPLMTGDRLNSTPVVVYFPLVAVPTKVARKLRKTPSVVHRLSGHVLVATRMAASCGHLVSATILPKTPFASHPLALGRAKIVHPCPPNGATFWLSLLVQRPLPQLIVWNVGRAGPLGLLAICRPAVSYGYLHGPGLRSSSRVVLRSRRPYQLLLLPPSPECLSS
jgi:hypothetical protein